MRVVVDVVAEYGGTFVRLAAGQIDTTACGLVDDRDRPIFFDKTPLLREIALVKIAEDEPLSVSYFGSVLQG